ncbi:MAG: TIGR04283 family arsenosugar biosynthesis glycosyltransferase [Spirochaetaceae bacterium]
MSLPAGFQSPEEEPLLSVIIPVYREEQAIPGLLHHLTALPRPGRVEIIIVDGGGGSTLAAAEREGFRYARSEDLLGVVCPPGRGRQLNSGARLARGSALLFLHVDTRLPREGFRLLLESLESREAGAFDLRFESSHPGIRMVGMFGKVRSRLTRIPYGDQAHFIRAETFHRLGGYPEIPLMEDVALMSRIKHRGIRIRLISPPARTSDRRYKKQGALLNVLGNWWRILRYRGGVSPERLAPGYRTHNQGRPDAGSPDAGSPDAGSPDAGSPGASSGPQKHRERQLPGDVAQALFFREPKCGSVKTRLAAEIGEGSALECYQAMLADMEEKLMPLAPRIHPYIAPAPPPPGGGASGAAPGNGEGVFSHPYPPVRLQRGESLGERMQEAIGELHREGYGRVVLTGTDLPDLTPEVIEAAWAALEAGEVVLGPNPDGGYYLIGFRAGCLDATVFAVDRWGDESVYERTLSRIETAALKLRLLPPAGDIDTLEDLRRWRRHALPSNSPRLWNFSGQIDTL